MKVIIPTMLRSLTAQQSAVEGAGATLAELLVDLDRQYPGLRLRLVDEQGKIRSHMRIFVNREQVNDTARTLAPADEVHFFQALSGGL